MKKVKWKGDGLIYQKNFSVKSNGKNLVSISALGKRDKIVPLSDLKKIG